MPPGQAESLTTPAAAPILSGGSMADTSTDEGIEALITMKKTVLNPAAKDRQKGQHVECDYEVAAVDGSEEFGLYTRQSLLDPDSFSCGLRWKRPGGEDVTLVRYNGPAHPHRNAIEGVRFVNQCHIHRATVRYMARLNSPDEAFAEATTKYKDLRGALQQLLTDCNIGGLSQEPVQVAWKM